MTRSHKILGFLLVAIFGIYGCAKGPVDTAARSEKDPNEQARIQRITEDLRAASVARDQFRDKLRTAETKHAQTLEQLEQTRAALAALTAERDTLKAELKARTAERDALAAQYDGFRKNLKDLIGQAESTRNSGPASPPTIPILVGTQPVAGSAISN